MKKSDALFNLIHSMDHNEKRYFRITADAKRKDSNLARLFEVISKQKEYDEDEIKETFKGETFLKQIHVTKNHLYEAILKAMRLYNSEKSVQYKLKGMIEDIHFLYDKRLFRQCETQIRKTRKLAVRHDKYMILLELLDWEAKIMASRYYVGKQEQDIDTISESYYEILEKLQNTREYADLQSKIFNNYYKEGIERKNENYKTNDQIINQFILKDEKRAYSFKAKCTFYNIHSIYHKINGNWESTYKYRKELLKLFEDKNRGTQEDMNMHFAAINNLMPVSLKLNKFDEVEELIKKMRELPKRYKKVKFSEDLRVKIFTHSSIVELSLYVRRGMVDEGLEAMEGISKGLKDENNRFKKFPALHLYYNIAYFYFSIGQHSTAISWINKILNDTSLKSIEDIHASTRILTLILQFEQGREELLSYLARSTYRYLVKLEGLYKFEQILLRFIKKHVGIESGPDRKAAFRKLKKELEETPYEPGERNALSTIDLITWTESKIDDRPFYEIRQEKSKAK